MVNDYPNIDGHFVSIAMLPSLDSLSPFTLSY